MKHVPGRAAVSIFLIPLLLAGMPALSDVADSFGGKGPTSCDLGAYSGFDMAPAMVDSVAPQYPAIARKAKCEGEVVLKVFLEADGQVARIQVVKNPNPMLSKAAATAARSSTYRPASRKEKPVKGWLKITYPFDLKKWNDAYLLRVLPPVDRKHPLISDLGREIETREVGEKTITNYEFEGIVFVGDLSIRTYREAVAQIEPLFTKNETILRVLNRLVYYVPGKFDESVPVDLEILTCTEPVSKKDCQSGGAYRFTNKDGIYILIGQDGSRTRWDF